MSLFTLHGCLQTDQNFFSSLHAEEVSEMELCHHFFSQCSLGNVIHSSTFSLFCLSLLIFLVHSFPPSPYYSLHPFALFLPPSLVPSLFCGWGCSSGQKMPSCVTGEQGGCREHLRISDRRRGLAARVPSHSCCCCYLFQGCSLSSASSSSTGSRTRSCSLLPHTAPSCSSTATQRQNLPHGHGTPSSIITITHHKSPTSGHRACSHNPARLHHVKEVGSAICNARLDIRVFSPFLCI